MKSLCAWAAAAGLSLALCPPLAAAAQSGQPAPAESCGGQVFKAGEVTRRARIRRRPEPRFTEEARAHDVRGTVLLTAVLCHTGRVTNIRVVKGLPHGMTESAVESARGIKFEPALKDGREVSQLITLEYNFNTGGGPFLSDEERAARAGRLVEELIVEGNRRLTDEQILAHLNTRPGGTYNETTVRRDLRALLDLETLDPAQTRVAVADGLRGGVVVVFGVVERPVIRSIEFKGLKSLEEDVVLAALSARQPGLRREGVYNPAHLPDARRVVLELLAARGYGQAAVEVVLTEVSAVSVTLAFIVMEGPPARKDERPGRWF